MNRQKTTIVGSISLILLVIFVLAGISSYRTYNKIVAAENAIETDLAQIDTQLQRRFDLIPNLVKTVKGYAKHEKETFENITKLRSQWGETQKPDEKAQLANRIDNALGKIVLVAENYPALQASEQFLSLMYSLEGTENRISVTRIRYNESINTYNNIVKKFPGLLFGKEAKTDFFKATPKAQNAPVVDL